MTGKAPRKYGRAPDPAKRGAGASRGRGRGTGRRGRPTKVVANTPIRERHFIDAEKLYAWMNIYFGLFLARYGYSSTSVRMPSLATLWVRINAYFEARSNPELYKVQPRTGNVIIEGGEEVHSATPVGQWIDVMRRELPILVAYIDRTPTGVANECHPVITEKMLDTYVQLHRTHGLPRNLDWGKAPPEVRNFIQTAVTEMPPMLFPEPVPPGNWYDDINRFQRSKLWDKTNSFIPAGYPNQGPKTRYGFEEYVQGDVKLRAMHNAVVIPPIGYGLNPRKLLDEAEFQRVSNDSRFTHVPDAHFLALVRHGEKLRSREGDLYYEKYLATEP